MKKKTKTKLPRKLNSDDLYERARAKTWGGKKDISNRNKVKVDLNRGEWYSDYIWS